MTRNEPAFIIIILFISLFLCFPANVLALNNTANWNFNGNSTGWTGTNGSGTNTCGTTTNSTGTSMSTFVYNGSLSSQTAWSAVTGTSKGTDYRGNIKETVTAPGSDSLKAKGKFSYYASSSGWGTAWIRLDLYDSTNTNFVANLDCLTLSSNASWTTRSFGSDVTLTGGTTYAIRATLEAKTKTSTAYAITLGIDNIVVNFAPVGFTLTNPSDSTNAQLNWTTSTAGSGANGLHATTPYKIYRNLASPANTFLANSTTNSYTDTSTVGNTTYYYTVTNVDTASDESPKSAELSVLTRPGKPGTISFTNVSYDSMTLSWTEANGGANNYKVERCSGSACSNFSEITSAPTSPTYTDTNLTAGTLYRYRIRGSNSTGNSVYSDIFEQTTGTAPIISVTIDSSANPIDYGILPLNSQKSTIDMGILLSAVNDGNITENFNIKTSNATNGVAWTLGSTPGSNRYVHEFSNDGGQIWQKFTSSDTYQPLATSISIGAPEDFALRITTPTSTSDYLAKNIIITIQAVAP